MRLQVASSGCLKMGLFLTFLLLARVTPTNASFIDCYSICSSGMSEACCSCIGCDQSMRFGKRSEDGYKQARWLLRGVYGKRSPLEPDPSYTETDDGAVDFGARDITKLYALERLAELERLRRQQRLTKRNF